MDLRQVLRKGKQLEVPMYESGPQRAVAVGKKHSCVCVYSYPKDECAPEGLVTQDGNPVMITFGFHARMTKR